MGNRSYLIINKPGKPQEILFEGNNSLAHFWLLLLKEEDIENVRRVYRKAYDPARKDFDADTDIEIDKETALQNARRHRSYIQQVYPDLLSYYDEWTGYLRNQPSEDNTFYIDFIQIAAFYDNADAFLDSLVNFYKKVEERKPVFEKTLSDTTGWDGTSNKAFSGISTNYGNFPQAQSYMPVGAKAKTPGSIKALNYIWGVVSLLMVGGLFYLFKLFPHFWQHILIALLFAPAIYIIIKGFLVVEKWGNRMQRPEGK